MTTGTAYRVARLIAALVVMTVAAGTMFVAIIVLEPLTAEFGIGRGAGSLPYTIFMCGFAFGSVVIGRVADKLGVVVPAALGSVCLPVTLLVASQSQSLWPFCLVMGTAGLLGVAYTFGPMVADVSHWFTARRGLAVGIVISGSYIGGAIWPPILQHWVDTIGWREAMVILAYVSAAFMIPLTAMFYRRAPIDEPSDPSCKSMMRPLGMARGTVQGCLCVAGVGCCVAMAMPQVHIVPYVVDQGLAAMRGAEMLALMLGFGIISRIVSGWLMDRIGGLKTLLVGSAAQCSCLIGFMFADTLTSLYVMSAAFGLSQGGIVPSYTIIIRRFFPAGEAAWRIGLTLLFTITGMAIGGWIAGVLYDHTGSYTASFLNAIAFNVLNLIIALVFIARARRVARSALSPA